MSPPEDRAKAYRVFSEALELQASERNAFIDERCGDAPDVLQMVTRLLAIADADAAATDLLFQRSLPAAPDRIGRHYGPFRLLEALGAGGMGTVYRAERTDGIPQSVAVKVLSEGLTATNSAQFLREARILARLEHPSIARLIDVGIQEGDGWIAIELVRGQRITEYCDSHGLDVSARVRLLVAVADAVATAHRALVVHRDIKPTNVLVTEDGQPKLIDFGIASALSKPDETREATADIRRLFTPHYAAPEQVKGEPVTVATDVFGLGALAYRVLTGVEPFANATSAVAYLLIVTQEDVGPPSEAALAAGAQVGVVRRLRGDLDCILTKALEREPARRYGGVQEFQSDLQAYLEGRPVNAHAPSVAYRFAKFAKRRALGLSLVSMLVLGLGVGGLLYVSQEQRVSQARAAAARRGEFLERLLKSADPHVGRRDVTVAELLDSAASGLDQSLGNEPLAEASMLGLIVDTNGNLGRYAEGLKASDRQLALLRSHGASSLEVARALLSRGTLLRTHGRPSDSVAPLREAIELLRPLHNVDPDREAALHELGGALSGTGAEREAESLLRQAIALESRLNPAQRGEASSAQNDLAVLLGNEGRYAESADMARDALAMARKYLPPNHPNVLVAEQTYAMTLLNLHKPGEAEPLQRDIVARQSAVNGPEGRDTLIARVQLGETLADLGRFDEAQAILRPAAETLDRVEGWENRYATGAWSDYAVAACSGHDAEAGLAAARRILDIRLRTLKPDDWHLMGAQTDIGLCLVRLHRDSEAESVLLKAAASLEAARGQGFYTTQLAYKALRELYQRDNRPGDLVHITAKIKD